MNWIPQEKQKKALSRVEKEILFGGSRGGGKTDTGQVWLLYDIDKPYYRALVIRRNATDLSDWIDRARQMYLKVGGTYVNGVFEFPSGAKIRTGHLKDENAYTKYQGHEYHKMLMEELTHIPRESDYEKLISSCRSTHTDIKPQIFATTNPDGAGHEWVKERWGIPDRPDMNEVYKNGDRVFIPSTVYDNKVLIEADPGYLDNLKNLKDAELRRAWLEGSWEGFGVEGSYYRDSLIKAEAEHRVLTNLYDPFLKVYTWCDLGISDAFSIGYFQIAHNQWRVIDFDEFEGESLADVVARMRNKGYNYGEHFAPHDIEVRELGTGLSRKEVAANLGVTYNTAPKLGIQDGISALRMRFDSLWFDEEKTKLLRQRLARYRKEFDEARGIYKDKPYHDENSHAADMMRYWAVTNIAQYETDEAEAQYILQNRMRQQTAR